MKKIIIFLFLTPYLIFAQSEKDEKLMKKNSSISLTKDNDEKTSKRNIVQYDSYSKQKFENETSIFSQRSSYNYQINNWYSWGAPYGGYVGFVPSFYFDEFGLRQPIRIYTMNDGNKKTVKGKKTNYRLGLGYGYKNNLSFWGTAGKKTFFIAEYSTIVSSDKSSFMPYITMDDVIKWNDKKLDDIQYGGTFYGGVGTKFKKLGTYILLGYGWEINNFQFFDEFYILSNNGRYSIRNFEDTYFTGKVGLIYDHKFLSVKTDYCIYQKRVNLGLGINL